MKYYIAFILVLFNRLKEIFRAYDFSENDLEVYTLENMPEPDLPESHYKKDNRRKTQHKEQKTRNNEDDIFFYSSFFADDN